MHFVYGKCSGCKEDVYEIILTYEFARITNIWKFSDWVIHDRLFYTSSCNMGNAKYRRILVVEDAILRTVNKSLSADFR